MDRDTGRPQWMVEVLALDAERGEVIRVTVAGDQPKVSTGQPVRFDGLEAIPWSNNGKAGVAYRAASIAPTGAVKAAWVPTHRHRRSCTATGSRSACRTCRYRITHRKEHQLP